MFKVFKKFKTRLFLGILFIIVSTIVAVQIILIISDRKVKNTITRLIIMTKKGNY